ncbi:hypothetical protein [Vibrio owensii]|uniref:hypothetical protein n=1 Tax=Vibrio owensii TaxID=696485 RepID=UPI003CC59E17
MTKHILLPQGIISTKSLMCGVEKEMGNTQLIATLMSNLAHYGYTLSQSVIEQLEYTTADCMRDFWLGLEPELKALTGADRSISDFVVYKNFPREVMELSAAKQLVDQILIYLGVPARYLTEAPESRAKLFENIELKVLVAEEEDTLKKYNETFLGYRTKWSDSVEFQAIELYKMFGGNLSDMPFKANMITLALSLLEAGEQDKLKFKSATDVLRLAAGMSDADITLRTKVKFRRFKNKERKFFAQMLNKASNLEGDFAAREELWKRFMFEVRPSSYPKFTSLNKAMDSLYNSKCKTFASKVVSAVQKQDVVAIELLKGRPGEFLRQVHAMYKVYGMDAFVGFSEILPELSTLQLVQIEKYLRRVNSRRSLIFRPNGSWAKAIADEEIIGQKAFIEREDLDFILGKISVELGARLDEKFPHGVVLGDALNTIFLPTNDLELAPFGRGTEFDLPENAKFIRTCSYWEVEDGNHSNTWYDNGVNLFDAKFGSVGTCAWDRQAALDGSVIMSGDPASTQNDGKAAQLIDINIEEAVAKGARYALWSVLCFSNKTFATAKDVFAAMQVGEHSQEGELFEPSRALFKFPIKGENYTRYPALIDLVRRKVIFMDLPLKSVVQSAGRNTSTLEKLMPSVMEHVVSQPTLADLMAHASKKVSMSEYADLVLEREKQEERVEALKAETRPAESQSEAEQAFETVNLPVVVIRDDREVKLPKFTKGYVLNPVNEENSFERLEIQNLFS